jgi:hypothetical protein
VRIVREVERLKPIFEAAAEQGLTVAPLYPRPSGGAGEEEMKKQMPVNTLA